MILVVLISKKFSKNSRLNGSYCYHLFTNLQHIYEICKQNAKNFRGLFILFFFCLYLKIGGGCTNIVKVLFRYDTNWLVLCTMHVARGFRAMSHCLLCDA